ncbi:Chaperone protein dnaJ 49 [Platanthera zijinensis]|uniref:Chaperone protein dnaJ 49 n=1 Tax=Platanthera zijinensis TaxID=2320716 RepID=A0AAP0BQ95_9ASPA
MISAALSPNNIVGISPRVPGSRYKKLRKVERNRRKDLRCEVGNGGGRRRSEVASWAGEYDLYSLLGVETTSEAAAIRKAYRALQKRCHPDIAGPEGHDMAILLNQVYSFLSDPASRAAYDRERTILSKFHGYTGEPMYSRWLGPKSEQRAIFVDEVKCIGCLKCALHAPNTFAIELGYGRARVVSQWADPEDKILGAIDICPVDCISIVDRSDLAALEFLMSKQPRVSVRLTGGNNAGVRVADVFEEVKKFKRKFNEMYAKNLGKQAQEADLHRRSRTSAMDAIKDISSWLYWQNFTSPVTQLTLTDTRGRRSPPPENKKIREAAAKLKADEAASLSRRSTTSHEHREEYWEPLPTLSTPSSSSNTSSASRSPELRPRTIKQKNGRPKPVIFGIPVAMAVIFGDGRWAQWQGLKPWTWPRRACWWGFCFGSCE